MKKPIEWLKNQGTTNFLKNQRVSNGAVQNAAHEIEALAPGLAHQSTHIQINRTLADDDKHPRAKTEREQGRESREASIQ